MRQSILSYLLAHRGEFISGQRLSEELGITRTAVWKHICMLREKGYTIDSYTKKGYCLTGVPDLLDPEEVSKKVHTSYIGKNVVYEERTASTNTVAKDLAHKGREPLLFRRNKPAVKVGWTVLSFPLMPRESGFPLFYALISRLWKYQK